MLHTGPTSPLKGSANGSTKATSSVRAYEPDALASRAGGQPDAAQQDAQTDCPGQQLEPRPIDDRDRQSRLGSQALERRFLPIGLQIDGADCEALREPIAIAGRPGAARWSRPELPPFLQSRPFHRRHRFPLQQAYLPVVWSRPQRSQLTLKAGFPALPTSNHCYRRLRRPRRHSNSTPSELQSAPLASCISSPGLLSSPSCKCSTIGSS